MKGGEKLRARIEAAAADALAHEQQLVPVDVMNRIGWCHAGHQSVWRHSERPLSEILQLPVEKLAFFLDTLEEWARAHDVKPIEGAYAASARGERALRFVDGADADTERRWRTHWVPAQLSEKRTAQIAKRLAKKPDIVVVDARQIEWSCAGCGAGGGALYKREDAGTLCLECVDLDHLVFLPAGDAALSRRAKARSALSALVMRYSRAGGGRWERQGVLVEERALEEAEQHCLADAAARAARAEREELRRQRRDVAFVDELTRAIVRLFPGCPPEEAYAIAAHAGERGSGRVGRSRAGRELDESAVQLAVVASIRHRHTRYDELLMSGVEREQARARVRDDIDDVVARWRA